MAETADRLTSGRIRVAETVGTPVPPLITQRSQVQILSPLLIRRPPKPDRFGGLRHDQGRNGERTWEHPLTIVRSIFPAQRSSLACQRPTGDSRARRSERGKSGD